MNCTSLRGIIKANKRKSQLLILIDFKSINLRCYRSNGIAIMYIGIRFAFGSYNPFYIVASGSMIPTLNISDFVITNHNIPFSNLKVGDIIVFKSPLSLIPDEQHKAIVHSLR
jgi:hypothetical protein